MLFIILSCLILFTATIHIKAEYTGPRKHVYIFKPLTTSLIIVIAILAPTQEPFYQQMIVLGLIFSLFGDIFKVKDGRRCFLPF